MTQRRSKMKARKKSKVVRKIQIDLNRGGNPVNVSVHVGRRIDTYAIDGSTRFIPLNRGEFVVSRPIISKAWDRLVYPRCSAYIGHAEFSKTFDQFMLELELRSIQRVSKK